MKKTIALFLVLALFALTGCERAGEKNERTVDTVRSFSQPYKIVIAAETGDTVYYMGSYDRVIKYVDKATGITGPLCGKPECKHNDETCNAYTGGLLRGLYTYNGRLYWMDNDPDDGEAVALFSVAPDGTDRRKVTSLSRDLYGTGSHSFTSFALGDGYLYYGVVSWAVENGEVNNYNYVRAIPLDPEEESFEIMRERATEFPDGITIQLYGDYLYIHTSDGDGGRFTLRRWNVNTREFEMLIDEPNASTTLNMWVTDDGVYFDRNGGDIYRYDLETGEYNKLFTEEVGRFAAIFMDNIVTGFELSNKGDSSYDFHVAIDDFEGNTLVDETYQFELGYAYYDDEHVLGRDENYAYYAMYDTGNDIVGYKTYYIAIIKVALDGSGAEVLCETTEERQL